MEHINWLIENYTTVLSIVVQVVGVFAAIAAVTPNKSDNVWADKLLKIINTLGLNVGQAKNQ